MAIYHLSVQMISRAAGRSAVASAAYRSAERIYDERLGLTMDFSQKQGVEYKEIMLPEGAPERLKDRAKLWNEVEAAEKRKNSQLAREVRVALPVECTREQQTDLLRDYVKEQFVDKGMIADFAIHRDNDENPHAHIMLTTREIGENGFGKKNRDWNRKESLLEWREEWAKHVNLELSRSGWGKTIDHRSYEDQGLSIEPTRHIGVDLKKARADGRELIQERMDEYESITRRNGERILRDPNIALEAITHGQATFSKRDVGRWLNTKTADAGQFKECLDRVMGSERLVELGKDRFGRERYTTEEMIQVEKGLLNNSRDLSDRAGHQVEDRFIVQAERVRTLDPEQAQALRHITRESGDIALVEGYAGAGKSYMLGAAREAWEAAGYRVRGAALAGKAAEGLEASSGIASRSIHSLEYAWKRGKDELGRGDVLVIDEAGMVGSRQMGRVLERAKRDGAKVVLVGDTEQLQAIEAGAPMRRIGQEVGQVSMGEIRRQREDWQKEATRNFAGGKTKEALEAYQERGHVHAHESQEGAMRAIVQAWDEHRRERPRETQIMLAYRRDEVRELNLQAKQIRRDAGELGRDFSVQTERGPREFAAGDRVYFMRNDRNLGVKNGTLGTVELMKKDGAVIRLDPQTPGAVKNTAGAGHKRVSVDFGQYSHLDHGYAATVHKSQGVTVDRAHVLAGDLFDKHSAYVGMSRHRERVDLHWSREAFGSQAELQRTLSRARPKEMAVDWKPEREGKPLPGKAELTKDQKEALGEIAERLSSRSDLGEIGRKHESATPTIRVPQNARKTREDGKQPKSKELTQEQVKALGKIGRQLSMKQDIGKIAKELSKRADRSKPKQKEKSKEKSKTKEKGKDLSKGLGLGRWLGH